MNMNMNRLLQNIQGVIWNNDEFKGFNPEYVMNVVCKLLNSRDLKSHKGFFKQSQLRFLAEQERKDVFSNQSNNSYMILSMMKKIGLIVSADEQGELFLIPELLPKNEPELIEWDENQKNQSLRFEYHYKVLPTIVIPYLIAELRMNILDETYWYTGLVLTFDNNQVLIKADIYDNRMFIWVSGSERSRHVLLGIIRDYFEIIHQRISGIQVTEQVPYKDIMIPYKHLLALKEMQEEFFIPQGLKEKVRVDDILNLVN